MKSVQKISETTQDRILEMDLSAELKHGVVVSNLAYDVAKELGLGEKECYQLAIAGMLHDIGKLKLEGYINGQEQNPMVIEELKYVRMHSTLGYEILKDQDIPIMFWKVFFIIMRILTAAVIPATEAERISLWVQGS